MSYETDRVMKVPQIVGARSEYRIIRTHGSLIDLEKAISALGDCAIHGAPFRDPESREWCQAVTVRVEKPGEVRLQEPDKAKRGGK